MEELEKYTVRYYTPVMTTAVRIKSEWIMLDDYTNSDQM